MLASVLRDASSSGFCCVGLLRTPVSRRGVRGSLLCVALEFVLGHASHDKAMNPKRNCAASNLTKGRLRRKRVRGTNSGGPEFEVAGQHVVFFVALVFAAAWAAGLLPDP